jgi:hypothetical protein
MTKIYESPDGGKTVYEREAGTSERTMISTVDYSDDDCIDLDDLITTTIDVSSLSISSSSISSSSITGNVYSFNDNSRGPTDITIHDENGKEYSFRNMFDRLDTIEKRLTILRPDDKMLEKYELLQSLYDQYKAAEALLYGEEDDSEN